MLAEQNERVAVVSEEAGSLFAQVAGRYSKNADVDLDLWLKGYDGGTTRVGRISRKQVSLERPSITAIVTPQPSLLRGLAEHPEFRGRGFIARWLFVLPESLVGTRSYRNRPVSPESRDAYVEAIKCLARLTVPEVRDVPAVCLEGQALDLWTEFHDRYEREQGVGGRLEHMRDWASKLAGKVARIAACFHVLEHRNQEQPWEGSLTKENVAAAWTLGQYFLEHALAVHALMGADENTTRARQILGWIRRNELRHFSRRDCQQAHKSLGEPDHFDPWLRILEARGFIRKAPSKATGPKGGRPFGPAWNVNPLAHNPHNPHNRSPAEGCEGYEGYEPGVAP